MTVRELLNQLKQYEADGKGDAPVRAGYKNWHHINSAEDIADGMLLNSFRGDAVVVLIMKGSDYE